MPLTAVEPTRLYRQIADQIARLIDAGEFAVGARLPAERDLAHKLGVSRTSVREAIISLELAGRVEVRVGTGIFVCEKRPPAAELATPDLPGPFDLLAARKVIEGEIAALAAPLIRKADLDVLRDSIEHMRTYDAEGAPRDAADRLFHTTIAQASGNAVLVSVVNRLWDARAHPLWMRIESHFHTPALRARTLEDHAAIVAALAARDADAARKAMHRHLSRVAREFQRQVELPGAEGGPSEATAAGRKSRAVRRNQAGGVAS